MNKLDRVNGAIGGLVVLKDRFDGIVKEHNKKHNTTGKINLTSDYVIRLIEQYIKVFKDLRKNKGDLKMKSRTISFIYGICATASFYAFIKLSGLSWDYALFLIMGVLFMIGSYHYWFNTQ